MMTKLSNLDSRLKFLGILLPGLLPLIVFIFMDELFDTQLAIISAVSLGAVVTTVTSVKHKKLDFFILFDTILLAIFGGVSLILNNDIFFKLKPGIIQTILVVILAISAFSNKNLIISMTKRYIPNQKLTNEQIKKLKNQVTILFWILSFHTVLIYYSAFYLSKESWAFISGALFYILIGIWILIEFVLQYVKNRKIEWLPIINEKGEIVGKSSREQCHSGQKLLHPVVHLHVFNNKNELFIQKRSETKQIQPGKWDTSVGGHVSFNESILKSLNREAKEEIGIDASEAKFLFAYIWESEIEMEMVYVHLLKTDQIPKIDKREVVDGKFLNLSEIKEKINNKEVTTNFINEFKLLNKHLKKMKIE